MTGAYWVGPLLVSLAWAVALLAVVAVVGLAVLACLPWPTRRVVGRSIRRAIGLD